MISGSFLYQLFQGLRAKWLLATQALLLALMATTANAATFNVTTAADEADANIGDGVCQTVSAQCSLRAAIQEANATPATPDTINLPTNTYNLTLSGANEDQAASGDLDITSEITINGSGTVNSVIDGQGKDRVFHVLSGGKLTVTSLTIQNGKVVGSVGGGIYNNGGTVSMDQVAIDNNTAVILASTAVGGNGGGVYNSGIMTISTCDINGNTADTSSSGGGGGGVYNFGTLTITNCNLKSNTTQNTTSTNGATPGGGALQNEGVSGIGANTNRTIITGSTISNNTAPLGGAVRNLFGRVIIDTSVIETNTADLSGGGVENVGGNVTITRTVVRDNVAPQSGGGIDNLSTMDIGGSTINNNKSLGISPTAGGSGGGIFNSGDGILTIFNSTITKNSALQGGGLYNHKEARVTNSTIYDNTVTSEGSEVYACGNKDESVSPPLGCNNGITDSDGNQIIHTKFLNTIVGNSITATNCAGDVADLISDVVNPAVHPDNSTIGHNLETADTCGFAGTGDLVNKVYSSVFDGTGLAYNGGLLSSLKTYALPTSSPAHNTADISECPEIDERGFKRNEGDNLCDMGAYEISSTDTNFAVLDLALDIQYKNATPQNGAVQTTITFSVVNKGPLDGNNVILTAKIPNLSWLKITSLGSNSGSCTQSTDGATCTVANIKPYQSADFFVATLSTQSGSYTVDGEVKSDGADNYRPDNLKSVTITIPTVSGSSVNGNNFGGATGGGAMGWLTLLALCFPVARRLRRR